MVEDIGEGRGGLTAVAGSVRQGGDLFGPGAQGGETRGAGASAGNDGAEEGGALAAREVRGDAPGPEARVILHIAAGMFDWLDETLA